MKKQHATLLILVGLLVIVLAASITMDSGEKREGYSVGGSPDSDALACCTVGEKTCYALDGDCTVCESLCS